MVLRPVKSSNASPHRGSNRVGRQQGAFGLSKCRPGHLKRLGEFVRDSRPNCSMKGSDPPGLSFLSRYVY